MKFEIRFRISHIRNDEDISTEIHVCYWQAFSNRALKNKILMCYLNENSPLNIINKCFLVINDCVRDYIRDNCDPVPSHKSKRNILKFIKVSIETEVRSYLHSLEPHDIGTELHPYYEPAGTDERTKNAVYSISS
jgi:hypothetical protein